MSDLAASFLDVERQQVPPKALMDLPHAMMICSRWSAQLLPLMNLEMEGGITRACSIQDKLLDAKFDI
uniref:Uncharacterized protein n=1 Tax=Panagrellus redivivus TaxID=6233 RepID=A0A7E4UM62_PANRE